MANPTPRRFNHVITPPADARPNALPPAKTSPWISETRLPGVKTPVSRVPGAPPRTSTAAVVPAGGKMTVQPVRPTESVQCPIR
jgi:hypothetical protein